MQSPCQFYYHCILFIKMGLSLYNEQLAMVMALTICYDVANLYMRAKLQAVVIR